MLALERRNLILEELQDEKRVVVSELSHRFKVSEETIRRDLEKLEADGYATKSYGGAILNENVGFDMPLTIRSRKNVAEKQKIANIAAELVHDGDHIMLDASSTDLFIAKALRNKQKLTVVTNSIEILLELSEIPDWNLISTGGMLKSGYLALVGTMAEETAENYFVDKAFISCKALDYERGIMDSFETFSRMKKKALQCSAKSYLVLDGSKFDSTAFTRTAGVEEVSGVITDRRPDDRWTELFHKSGVELIYPGSEKDHE